MLFGDSLWAARPHRPPPVCATPTFLSRIPFSSRDADLGTKAVVYGHFGHLHIQLGEGFKLLSMQRIIVSGCSCYYVFGRHVAFMELPAEATCCYSQPQVPAREVSKQSKITALSCMAMFSRRDWLTVNWKLSYRCVIIDPHDVNFDVTSPDVISVT